MHYFSVPVIHKTDRFGPLKEQDCVVNPSLAVGDQEGPQGLAGEFCTLNPSLFLK